MNLIEKIKHWEMRRCAEKYKLDFTCKCCFREQVKDIGTGIKNGNGEIAEIPMKSGKIGLYKVTAERFSNMSSDPPAQYNWSFEFQGYKDEHKTPQRVQ